MWRREDVEVGGCGDVGKTMEESRFFIHQIHTHTLKTYIPPPPPNTHTLHTLTITVASPVKLLPLTASFFRLVLNKLGFLNCKLPRGSASCSTDSPLS